MKAFSLLFLCLFSPLFVSAFSGEVIISNITQKHHRKTDAGSAVYYQIVAKKSIRAVSTNILFFVTEESAAEKFYYQEGTLSLAKIQLHFKKAFLYNGNLILNGVSGKINGQACQAERLSFLINDKKIKAEKIIFSTANTIKIKRRYEYSVNPYLNKQL